MKVVATFAIIAIAAIILVNILEIFRLYNKSEMCKYMSIIIWSAILTAYIWLVIL